MSPFKVVENFQLKRDLVTFLQNSVRDPKLQLEDMKVKLHACDARRGSACSDAIEEYGEDSFTPPCAAHRGRATRCARIRSCPTAPRAVLPGFDPARERAPQDQHGDHGQGRRMTLDFRGSSPEFLNRSINTNIASFKTMLFTGF